MAGHAKLSPSLAHAWNAHEIALQRDPGSRERARGLPRMYDYARSLRIAAMWFFLGPLIIILGTTDVLTRGRSRNWPLGEKPVEH